MVLFCKSNLDINTKTFLCAHKHTHSYNKKQQQMNKERKKKGSGGTRRWYFFYGEVNYYYQYCKNVSKDFNAKVY